MNVKNIEIQFEVTKILKNEVTTSLGKIKFETLAICVNGLAKQIFT